MVWGNTIYNILLGGIIVEKIGIVLLNYKNYDDTINCIKTIKKQSYKNYDIIVVDNFSENDSINIIRKNFENENNVYYIQNNNNLGFAQGNNIGIRFAKEELKSDYVFVLNTDTVLEDEDILKKIIKTEYKDCAIINPMCCDIEHNIQRPYLICKESLNKYFFKLGLYLIGKYFKTIFNINTKSKKNNNNLNKEINESKYVIQGCAYMLTPKFFEYYNQLFPETFLYCEELALCVYIDKKKLKTIVNPDVVILHKEGGSSVKIIKDIEIKKIKHQIKSFLKVLKMYVLYDYKKIYKKYNFSESEK